MEWKGSSAHQAQEPGPSGPHVFPTYRATQEGQGDAIHIRKSRALQALGGKSQQSNPRIKVHAKDQGNHVLERQKAPTKEGGAEIKEIAPMIKGSPIRKPRITARDKRRDGVTGSIATRGIHYKTCGRHWRKVHTIHYSD